MNISYSHARNNYPAPPVVIQVENGVIVSFAIKQKAIEEYTAGELAELFKACGVGSVRIFIPFPEKFENVPISSLRFRLRPGKYKVKQRGDDLELPEAAFSFSVTRP